MTRRPTISATIIALDEERNLAELLPMLEWTDEILVVDGGSSDRTVEVAEAHGCDVINRRMESFAAQRNLASRLARGDWVLSIDADERPTPELVEEIRQSIAHGGYAGFRVPIRSSIFGRRFRYSGTQDDQPVRLARRAAATWVGDVHEVLQVAGPVGRLRHWLVHRTLPDLPSFLAKMHRYTSLEARARARSGRAPAWHEPWIAPPREVFRRLIWKRGVLDGPAGWTFCLLSGLSAWALAHQHRRLWQEHRRQTGTASAAASPAPQEKHRHAA